EGHFKVVLARHSDQVRRVFQQRVSVRDIVLLRARESEVCARVGTDEQRGNADFRCSLRWQVQHVPTLHLSGDVARLMMSRVSMRGWNQQLAEPLPQRSDVGFAGAGKPKVLYDQ